MRVIAGSARGRQLKGPRGRGTRPMTDRLKVSLFDMLSAFGLGGIRVLDLYAGTGSLGIEMLSRGADWADFVEQNSTVCRIIQDNLATTRLDARARVYTMPVARFLSMKSEEIARRSGSGAVGPDTRDSELGTGSSALTAVDSNHRYDIILLDPPYADPAIEDTLQTIALSPLLAEDSLVVIGHANRVKLADEYGAGRIRRVRHRAMGDSAFSIYTNLTESETSGSNESQPD